MLIEMKRDHGGDLDDAVRRFGGVRADWIDLSTGINPVAYPLPHLPEEAWTALPDRSARDALDAAARRFWRVPEGAALLASPGASAAIAMIPRLRPPSTVHIPGPTYNEHAASFSAAGWRVDQDAVASVHVNPNNPDGRQWKPQDLSGSLRIIDESFADVTPEATLISEATTPGTLILKSFGKFWGHAGLRLGFVIGDPELIETLTRMLGPWPVAGPALSIGTTALDDAAWAEETRERLTADANRLDALMTGAGAVIVGGTSLFRLYEVGSAKDWQTRLARHRIWTRVFPYDPKWLRLGLPASRHWDRLATALE